MGELAARRTGCEGCPSPGRSFVPGIGPLDATTAFIGQGPGQEEAEGHWSMPLQRYVREPFIGRAGQKLDRWLEHSGWKRSEVWIDNVVRCWLPANRAPNKGELSHCTQAYSKIPRSVRLIVPVGVPAINWALGFKAGERYAGTLHEINGRYVLGILHPARILRAGWALEPAQIDYLIYAREVHDRLTHNGKPNIVGLPGTSLATPTFTEISTWAQFLGDGVSVDIETTGIGLTDKIRGIGFCRLKDEVPIWIPFLRADGQLYWNPDQWESIRFLVQAILGGSIPKIFHNGVGFDIIRLQREGFRVSPPYRDTMIELHAHQPEMKKSLEWSAVTHLRFPTWKDMLAEEEEEGLK